MVCHYRGERSNECKPSGIFQISFIVCHYRGERSNEYKLSGIFQISFIACHYRGKLESYKKLRVESPTDVIVQQKVA